MSVMHTPTFRAKLLPDVLLFVAVLASQLCRAEEVVAEALQLTRTEGPLELLRRKNIRWQAAWGAEEVSEDASREALLAGRDDLGEAHVTAPVGERVVTVTLSLHFTLLLCEESRRSVGGFLRGRCTLRPSPALSQSEFFFNYRVPQKATEASDAATAPRVPQTCRLYEENAGRDTELEVGTVTYEEKENAGEGQTADICIRLRPTRAAPDAAAWLSGALRLTGVSTEEVERRRWRRRAASTVVGRWGYPLLAVLVLHGGLFALNKIFARRHPPAAGKPKHD
ncbi:uncharacterized protein Tco025E_03935 [Trypanosoma conorhini]|uniref:Transmembrane protein n=1 Tax=Trypanosoma conorhini TaxID=83891 RepID=A0A3R7NLB2_9TRYP|nr:uncharacterized protein Tco025E_03935 [Trypanosoma conorhini]RNF20045.1 hypothetical protein Tco025E_03935 [Trypanosoma conorhini]